MLVEKVRSLPPRTSIIRLGEKLVKLSIVLVLRIEENVAPGEQKSPKNSQ